MLDVSPGQKLTRRRALGRRFIRKAADLNMTYTDLMHSSDLEFLTEREKKMVDKLMSQVRKVATHLDKIGTEMDVPS